MNLSREEQETIILFNEAEKTAVVDTCNKRLRKQLAQYCSENCECSLVFEDDVHAKYVCPKSWVKIKKPRQLSSEQREKLALRAKQNFHTANISTASTDGDDVPAAHSSALFHDVILSEEALERIIDAWNEIGEADSTHTHGILED